MRFSERSAPSFESAILYVTAILTTWAVSTAIMLGIVEHATDYEVNRSTCTCDCFDRRFKGLHFNPKVQYRHVYFNMTPQTTTILLWFTLHVALLLAFVHRALLCGLSTLHFRGSNDLGHLRLGVFACSLVNFYGLVYGWWVMFNYINDAWHWSLLGVLWPTQLFFSATDLIPAYVMYTLLPSRSSASPRLQHLALTISFTHVLLALWDQGAGHIVSRDPLASRDVMLFFSDVAALLGIAPYSATWNREDLQRMAAHVVGLGAFYSALKFYVGSY